MTGWLAEMQKIDISVFRGMAPRVSPALLDHGQGVTVIGECISGALRPWRVPKAVARCPVGTRGIFLTKQGDWLNFPERIFAVSAVQPSDVFGRTYYTKESGGLFVTSPGDAYREFLAGVPSPTTAPTVVVTGVGAGSVEDRVYLHTFVNAWGEESGPSPASASREWQPGQTITISGFGAPATGYKNVDRIRLYRLSVGGQSSVWRFVAEFALGLVEYVDSVLESALGNALPTEHFVLPQPGARGLVQVGGGGVLATFQDNEVAFCEPYLPYAFPNKYRLTVSDRIMALGVSIYGVAVLTTGSPAWIGTAHTSRSRLMPNEYPMNILGEQTPCLSSQGAVQTEFGALFPASDGLRVILDGQPSKLITSDLLTRKEWERMFDPSNILGGYHDGTYFGFNGNNGFAYNFRTGALTWTGLAADAVHFNSRGLFVVRDNEILEWEGAGGATRATFRSKVFRFQRPINFAAFRNDADASEFWIEFNAHVLGIRDGNSSTKRDVLSLVDEIIAGHSVAGDNLVDLPAQNDEMSNLALKIWADGKVVFSELILPNRTLRIPGGFLAREWQIEIVSPLKVDQVAMGTSVRALTA